MKIKPGYKQTEVGVIPADWEVSTVGKEFTVQLGKMLDAEKNIGIPKTYIGNKSVQWGRIDISELSTVPMSRSDIKKFRLQKGDLLVCEGGEVGRAAIWDAPLAECYYQKALHRLRPLRKFDARLMVAILWQWSQRGILANYVTQTSIAHIPREKLVSVPIPRPPLAEQRAIAKVLRDTDALLDGLDRLIAKKRAIKLATMQQLLTGKNQTKQLPDGWRCVTLAEVCDIKTGSPPKFGGEKPYYDTSAVGVMGVEKAPVMVTYHNRPSRADCYPQQNAVGFAKMKGTRKTVFIDGVVTGAIFSTGFQFLMPKNDDVHPYFLFALVGSDFFQNKKDGVTPDGIMGGIPLKSVAKLAVTLPPLPEQKKIAAVLSDMDSEIAALEARRDKTRALKYAMMGELLTGKTRLVTPKQKKTNA